MRFVKQALPNPVEPRFTFSECRMCSRLHAIIDGANLNHLDGCKCDSTVTWYNLNE